MDPILLPTKTQAPALPVDVLHRARLLERLSAGLAGRLTLVVAPAGYGKTTLVADWLATLERPSVWLQLDRRDDDPGRFFAYLVAALQRLQPQIGAVLSQALNAQELPPTERLAAALVAELDKIQAPFCLVLDDYHFIEQADLHAAVQQLLDYAPPQLHLVLTSRSDPPLALARMRVRQQLNEIRLAELQFSEQEVQAFLNRTRQLALEPDAVHALRQRTEGWAAGLHLAALNLGQGGDPQDFIRQFSGSDRFVMDYLVDEVLADLPQVLQDFMLQLSLLERFSADLAQAVTGRQDSRKLLRQIEQANLFLIPLDHSREWYRYHHLFAELLQHRLQQATPQLIPELHQRAGAWFEAQGELDEAFPYFLQAGVRAGQAFAERHVYTLVFRGEALVFRRWIQQLPPEAVQSSLLLQLGLIAMALVESDVSRARRYLAHTEALAAETPPGEQTRLLRLFQLHIQGGQTPSQAAEDLVELIAELEQDQHIQQSEQHFLQGYAYFLLAYLYRVLDATASSEQAYRQAAYLNQQAHSYFLAMLSYVGLAELYSVMGRLRAAEETYQQAERAATERGRTLPVGSLASIGRAKILREWDRPQEALALLEEAIKLGTLLENPSILVDARYTQALTLGDQGNWEAAHVSLDGAAQAVHLVDWVLQDRLLELRTGVFRAWLWLREGRIARAYEWARASGLGAEDVFPEEIEQDYLVYAAVLLAQARQDRSLMPQVNRLLARLVRQAQAGSRAGQVIHARLLQARAAALEGREEAARQHLQAALELAEPEGYMRLFVNNGPEIQRLLLSLPPGGDQRYRRQLLEAFEAEAQTAPPQALPEPLSERELQVLRLIAAGLSNQQIADELYLALGTVKVYSSNAYSKLGVSRRTEAVEKARSLGLL